MKYGFVYIWYDRKHKRYYIGAHWGAEDDGYICSSTWMKQAYTKRPADFKRRILVRIHTNRQDMFNEEARWQALIKDEELKKRYYNIRRHGDKHWSADEQKTLTVKEKLKAADNTKGLRAHAAKIKGTKRSEAFKQKISDTLKGKPLGYTRTAETRQKISENSKRLQALGKVGMHGKQHTDNTKAKMSINNAMNNPLYRDKISEANRGKVGLWLNNQKKMAKPGTELYELLLAQGYKPKEELLCL